MKATQGPSWKLCKLIQHVKTQPKNYAGEDIALCPRDFPFIVENDVVEIYNPEDESSPRLLLRITKGSLRDDFTHKDAISIEQSIAVQFQLKNFPDVIITKVDERTVELDSLELTFKDQYLGRSEMWRLKNSLVNACIYLNKRIEFACSTIRCQVYEMWLHGNKVSRGVVTPVTKIVFRSSSSMVYLFIQMSSEMWDFDIYGDLYFEKAVNGFLAELFAKWKKNGSNHEVTIVLFSRLYYQANSLDQFSESLRQCLQTDYKGRFYEDYYRVAVQNEKFEDWGSVLTHLRHLFVEYQSSILNAHSNENNSEQGRNSPKAFISSAAQGNVLEVLNMSLNVFEKHYHDRSLDRTGQLSVVITPGVGVFEVDRELSNLTMQRVIDNGVGSDLVCVGEQPLHAVPLLKFHNKNTNQNAEDYSMPHWINQSFYSSNKKVGYSYYVPRIKLPTRSLRRSSLKSRSWDSTNGHGESTFSVPKPKQNQVDSYWPNSVYDFDDYDSKVFQLPTVQTIQRRSLQKKRTNTLSDICIAKVFHRQNSEPEIYQGNYDFTSTNNPSLSSSIEKSSLNASIASTPATPAITIPSKTLHREQMYSSSFGTLNLEMKSKTAATRRGKWYYDDISAQSVSRNASSFGYTSHGGSPKEEKLTFSRNSDSRLPSRALINPFDPSHAVIKLTSNRRRWTHIFPRGPSGVLIQQHHFQSTYPKLEIVHESTDPVESPKSNSDAGTPSGRSGPNTGRQSIPRQSSSEGISGKQKLALLWGATGEQEWSCALQTGVDWKSLTIPACLPITTDYFPDERSLQIDYVVSDYNLLPDLTTDYLQQKAIQRCPLTPNEVFHELVSQRLAQGFQMIVKSNNSNVKAEKNSSKYSLNSSLSRTTVFPTTETEKEEYFLSIGRVFHKISLDGSTINVTRYRPRHAYPSIKIHYIYQFHGPNNSGYEISCANFCTEKLENYNWNYLDHYICTRGDRDFVLLESLKYWRFRMLLLPSFQIPSKKSQEGIESLNLFSSISMEDKCNLVESFIKFVEVTVNRRIRRPNSSGKKVFGLAKPINPLGFRERLGSNRAERSASKPVSRSGSSVTRDADTPHVENLNPEASRVPGSETSLEGMSQLQEKHGDDSGGGYSLSFDATIQVIADALCTPNSGLSFVKCDDLPKMTFVSSDAVLWLISNMEGIDSEAMAVKKFEEMLNDRLICHASGNTRHHFIVGFYLYFFVQSGDPFAPKPEDDLGVFQNEWMEVKVDYDRVKPPVPPVHWTCKILDPSSADTTRKPDAIMNYHQVYVDVDVGKKSDRQEWAHLRYQPIYRPDEAFEIVIQWVQATGSIITELVQSWSRKAQQCNLQLIPIPNDPFAFLSSAKSDSLRGPVFIPLNLESLMGSRSYLFEEFPEDTWDTRTHLFQNAIVQYFGFIPMANADIENGGRSKDHYYIHSSGNMFILIQSRDTMIQGVNIKDSPRKSQRFNESPANSQDTYITRHVSGKNRDLIPEERVGFLWSWNYMVSKRWKTSSTHTLGDDSYTLKLLKDFMSFCDNQNNRLTKLWESKISEGG